MKRVFADEGWDDYLHWHALAGFWSRRITDEHRMVYWVDGDALLIGRRVLW